MGKPNARGLRMGLGIALGAAALCAALLWLWPKAALSPPAPSPSLVAAAQGLDSIAADADFDPVARTLAVRQTCTLINRTGAAQRLLVLRAYPNAFASEETSPAAIEELFDLCYPDGFSAGGLTLTGITVALRGEGEQPADYAFGDDAKTVLRLSLPWDWAAGDTLIVRAQYAVRIPQAAYRFGESDGLFALGNALLIPAPYRDGEYVTDAYAPIGEPFMSECRNYTVRVTAPTDYTVAGSAAAVTETEANGLRTVRMEALAARDFALCISRRYLAKEALQDGVLVRAYARTADGAGNLLAYALAALRCYGERYGAYPYPSFTLCEAVLPVDATAYPALAMLSAGVLATGGETLEQLVARETAQQWWGAVIGTDAYRQPWQDEALSEFSLLDYWETAYGEAARDALQFARLETAMRVTIPQGVTPGSPIDYFGDLSEYRVVVNGRGGAAMCALNDAMNGGLDAFLRRYYETFAFALASRADFEALLASATGEDWSPLLSDYLDTYLSEH